MSNFKTQLHQLIEAADSIAAQLKQTDPNPGQQAQLKAKVVSVLPLAERYERLFRTTDFNDVADVAAPLEASTIGIWNAAALAMKLADEEERKLLCSVKFFASLLCSIKDSIEPSIQSKLRLLNCFYRVLGSVLDENETKLTNKVQEHADRVFKNIETSKSTFDDNTTSKFNRLRVVLFTTKMHLSIQENDIQMAKFYEERADLVSSAKMCDPDAMAESIRIIYNSSLSLYNQKRITDSIYFLSRAAGYIANMGEISSPVLKRNISPIYSLLAKACLDDGSIENLKLAEDTLSVMQEVSDKSISYFKLLIKLVYTRNGDLVEVEDLIMRMLMSIKSSELKEALELINNFSTRDAASSLRCFEYAFFNNTDDADHHLFEMIFVSIVNIYVKDNSNVCEYKQQNLEKFFDSAQKHLLKPLSKNCSASCIPLLWNAGRTCSKNGLFEDSLGWFKLALHRILEINEIDKAKFQRNIQNSYVHLQRYDDAIHLYKSMDDKEKISLISQYNMFRVYSSKGDETNLMSCLKCMVGSEEQNLIPILSLCATNSQSSTRVAVESMLALFKKIDTGIDSKVSIPTALCCVVNLILKQDNYLAQYSEALLTIFRETHKFASDAKSIDNYKFTTEQLQWFSAQAFNISRGYLDNDDTSYSGDFAEISIQLNLLIPDNISAKQQFDLKLWRFRSMLTIMFCTHKDLDLDFDIRWKEIRTQSLDLRLKLEELTIINEHQTVYEEFREQWELLLVTCMAFQLQAELELEHWSAAEVIVKESRKVTTQDFDTTVVNLITESERAPENIKSNILTQILERNLGDPDISAVRLARWVRLLLKYNGNGTEAHSNSLKIIQQIILRISSQKEDNQFPAHEIEWIATTCWNIGVRTLANDNDKVQGRAWCERAIKMASFVNERTESYMSKLWSQIQHMVE